MTYTITALRKLPDDGFRAINRHTAEGALEAAAGLRAEGMREVEVHDDRGQLLNPPQLARAADEADFGEQDVLQRLMPADESASTA